VSNAQMPNSKSEEHVPEARESHDLVGSTIAIIRERIKRDRLGVGDPLPSEAQLTREVNVSRTVVREAYKSLAALGVVDLRPGKKPLVARLGLDSLANVFEHGVITEQITVQQVYDVRRTIEARTAALAALRRTDEEAELICRYAEQMRQNYRVPPLVMESDIAFHEAISQASHNPAFSLLVYGFSEVTKRTWVIGWRTRSSDGEQLAMIQGHINIAEAITKGDPKLASALMVEHFDLSIKALLEAGLF
jgi:GntR family transcriptional regulator, transcriptional repressor for pyruvate dehydrogenase complex